MTKDRKEAVQYASACVMLASGVILTFLCFFLNHYKIEDSVLWYLAQTLVYAGSIFGVGMYINARDHAITSYVEERISRIAKEKEKP